MLFRRLRRGLEFMLVLGQAWLDAPRRALIQRMVTFSRNLPQQFDQPLPVMMAQLTPSPPPPPVAVVPEPAIRQLADAVAAWHVRSPLGICLRRSLLRYYFLREAGVPVQVIFGARLKGAHEGGGVGGHAWLTLEGEPYYENPADYQGFVVMYAYPPKHES
ncbi:MAG: lasso peptide biosynthesis B2 protein [Anaerolineales bacterium]|nr:lasso peptide biosynthesis B2 protein [Anaerolineales bacterium]